MFIALDESIGNNYTVIGCLCFRLEDLPRYESEYISKRIHHKCWGELEWGKITSKYCPKYLDILKNYLEKPKITFHSWAYRQPSKKNLIEYFDNDGGSVIYKHECNHLKITIWKCVNYGIRDFYILLDERSDALPQYRLTREILEQPGLITPKPNIAFFSQIDSKICGAMQICSICTSAIRSCYETFAEEKKPYFNEVIKLLTSLNNNIDLKFSPKKRPSLFQYKFQHCLFDPLLKS